MKFKTYLKESRSRKKFEHILDVIWMIDEIPSLQKYAIAGAEYDDVHYEIPEKEFTKATGLTYRDLEKIEDRQNTNEGWVLRSNGVISFGGEA